MGNKFNKDNSNNREDEGRFDDDPDDDVYDDPDDDFDDDFNKKEEIKYLVKDDFKVHLENNKLTIYKSEEIKYESNNLLKNIRRLSPFKNRNKKKFQS